MQPVHEKYASLIPKIIRLFNDGSTDEEIGNDCGLPRRTIGKIRRSLNLNRSRSEAASIKCQSKLDQEESIRVIKQMRDSHSLREIAKHIGSSISAVHRICSKHGIAISSRYSKMQSERLKKAWNAEKKAAASIASKARVTPEIKKRLSENSKKLWADGKYRNVQAIQRANQSWSISSIQNILYSILDDLGAKYYREYDDKPNDPQTVVGPYNFDCAIPRDGKPTLLIECHGDYWHAIGKAVTKDKQKVSYIINNFSDTYEVKCIWEHEFKCRDKILELLKYWLGITKAEVIKFKLSDVRIEKIDVKTGNLLLNKYHYLSGCGRGGILYGAYLGEILIGVCAFSTIIRQNLPYDSQSTRELSRFCIHPNYQAKNLGSWFISRCIKLLPNNIKTIVSYCDTTFNHDGALYKASNFRLDGQVRPDYWYVNEHKWVMHKKSLYDHAKKMSVTENEFAEKNGYKRVYGTEKLRFIYDR